jgi:general secretion pathway protein I
LRRSIPHRKAMAGFTLVEALVALSVIATVLASIGALAATNVRATRSIQTHMTRLETARAIMTAIPDRAQLMHGHMSGETDGHPWRVEVEPFVTNNMGPQTSNPWLPLAVVVTIQSPTGAAMQISTVRLQRKDGR